MLSEHTQQERTCHFKAVTKKHVFIKIHSAAALRGVPDILHYKNLQYHSIQTSHSAASIINIELNQHFSNSVTNNKKFFFIIGTVKTRYWQKQI